MMEKNIESLARMMALFRQAGLAPKDYSKVVAAFDLAYSTAETYRTSHIEKVFGPLEKMDEPLFFLILSRMNANLGERWRKMDVQNAGLTRRDETQTLELVRAGYATALQLIDGWLAGHPDSSRALTLAGTLLTDWGDFEYFQELVAERRAQADDRLQGEEFAGAGIFPSRRRGVRRRRCRSSRRATIPCRCVPRHGSTGCSASARTGRSISPRR